MVLTCNSQRANDVATGCFFLTLSSGRSCFEAKMASVSASHSSPEEPASHVVPSVSGTRPVGHSRSRPQGRRNEPFSARPPGEASERGTRVLCHGTRAKARRSEPPESSGSGDQREASPHMNLTPAARSACFTKSRGPSPPSVPPLRLPLCLPLSKSLPSSPSVPPDVPVPLFPSILGK